MNQEKQLNEIIRLLGKILQCEYAGLAMAQVQEKKLKQLDDDINK